MANFFRFFAGAVIGALIMVNYFFMRFETEWPSDKRMGRTGFINPVLECYDPPTFAFKTYGLQTRLEEFVASLRKQNSGVDSIGLYFKDLSNGPVLGINEDSVILGGSLLKVPLMIGFLKAADKDPNFLSKKVRVNVKERQDFYAVQGTAPSRHLLDGHEYTLREIIEAAIIYSDNVAATILEDYNENALLKTVVQEMNIPISEKLPPYRDMTLKDYAGFFRILYNATYLSKENSNLALEILSRADFKSGLRAGVPGNIQIAHKFGEKIDEKNDDYYFSECGIVYHSERPYILCVSTKGKAEEKQIKIIEKISSFVFEEINQLNEK